MSDFATYLKIGDEYQPIPAAETQQKLPPGIYTVKYDPRTEQVSFTEAKATHDELVDLPGTAYDQVMSDLDWFFDPECKQRFEYVRLLHKMNILLHGLPGGGKTCIVNRVSLRTLQEKGIVLFNPPPTALPTIYRVLDRLQPETRVLIIFEELDQLIKQYNEEIFLHVLDGEVQKHNAMIIATTNYIDKVPARIKRPGRFPLRIEVGLPSLEARLHYCRIKLPHDEKLATQIAEMTENFNIDQLKDVIRAHYCMRKPLVPSITFLRKEFNIPAAGPVKATEPEDDDEDWEECDDADVPLPMIGVASQETE